MSIQARISETAGATAILKHRLVKTPGACVVTSSDIDVAIGIMESGVGAGQLGTCIKYGECTAVASGVIPAGARLAPDTAGRVKEAAAADMLVGFNGPVAAAADGDEIEIFFTPALVVIA